VRDVLIFIATTSLSVLFLAATLSGQSPAGALPPSLPAATPTPPNSQQPPGEEVGEDDVIKVSTNLVTSNALVLGRNRKYVPSLRREDFHVLKTASNRRSPILLPSIVRSMWRWSSTTVAQPFLSCEK